MNRITEWFADEAKLRIVRIVLSGIALVFSLGGWFTLPFGIDTAWIAIVLCGIPIIAGASAALVREHNIKADMMVSLALIGSLIAKEFFAAGEVAFIMEIGSALEDFTSARAKKGIEKLIRLLPKTARVKRNGTEAVVPAEDVRLGDRVIVLAGETIPVDGVILSGSTSIDQSVMTGESIPVDKTVGDEVISGTVNCSGVIEFRAASEEKNSSLQKMIELTREADENKAPIVGLADKWATWLVLFAMAAAVVTGIVNGLLFRSFDIAFGRAVTVLVVICPCAFILATPTAIMAGIGNASRHGLLVRSGEALQRFAKIDTVAFDKTGTLTYGKPKVIACVSLAKEAYSDADILRLAACAEQYSEHPLGKAIVEAYTKGGGALRPVKDYSVAAGNGVSASVEGVTVLAGKEQFLRDNHITPDTATGSPYLDQGATVTYLAADGANIGILALSDTIREKAPQLMKELGDTGIETLLLTGDNRCAAQSIADEVGIAAVRAELLPQNKQAAICELKSAGRRVCMIGDGINDAPALTAADAAIAMGGIGSDIAMESSDVVLVEDDIKRIPYLLSLSRRVLKKIKTNILLSLAINAAALILAATGAVNSVVGALVHNAGSVLVVVNSILLLRNKKNV